MMSPEGTQETQVKLRNSVFVKCMLLIAICMVSVVATIQMRFQDGAANATKVAVEARGVGVSKLLAMQLGEPIQQGKTGAINQIVSDVIDTAGSDFLGALVVNQAGKVVLTTGSEAFDFTAARDLAMQALATDKVMSSPTGKTIAAPVRSGEVGGSVGVIVTSWTGMFQLQALKERQIADFLLAVGVMVAALAVAGGLMFVRFTSPLNQLKQSMSQITAGDFEAEVPHANRHDEIGHMAVQLNLFRLDLALAKERARATAFKGAAFVGSSAPMMMADERFRITYINPACEVLMGEIMPLLPKHWQGATPENMAGADLRQIDGFDAVVRQLGQGATGSEGAGRASELKLNLGGRLLRLRIDPALDASGGMFGCVIEWSDLTNTKRNEVLIDALDTSLMLIEYDVAGHVVKANSNFLKLINGQLSDTSNCSLSNMFAGNLEGDIDGNNFRQQVLNRDIKQGQFKVYFGPLKQTYVMDGSFAVMTDEAGKVGGLVFLASDVTAQDIQRCEAENARANDAKDLTDVVELLGIALTNLSGGDLETSIDGEMPAAYGKLRTDFNSTVGSLREAILAVVHNADSIRNETGEITSAADDLSRRTVKQAATLEETAAALDELTASVRSAAAGADEASKMSNEAQKSADQGGDIARQAIVAMDGIKVSSQEISKITSVIDDIAFQTNLLALNAGVEAARAGEAGRGFAVVATEVRALAQRSSEAAREINTLISSSGDQVQQGVDLVDRTGAALADIVTSVSDISNRVAAIAGSAREQATGLAEINIAVTELDHVTQQNAAMFEETTAASHALTAEADALAHAVSRFRTGVEPLDDPLTSKAKAAYVQPKIPLYRGNAVLNLAAETDADVWEEF